MFDSINKIFINGFKLFFIILLGVFLYLSYFVSTSIVIYDNNIQFFSYLIGLYLYIITIYVFIIAFYKKFEKTYFYNIFLGPIIPTLFYLLRIIQYKTLLDINAYDLIGLFLLYFSLLVFTKLYIDYLSRYLIPILVGKSIEDPIGDDFAFISIYLEYDFSYFSDNFKLIEDIIENFLKYEFRDVKTIYHHKIQYEIFRYTRKNYQFRKPYFEHISLVRMRCIDTNYAEWLDNFDVSLEEPQPSLDVDCNHNSLIDDDIEIAEKLVYDCFFINQYYEDGDSISHIPSIATETYLAFNNILSKNIGIYCHKDDDILSSDLFQLRYNLFMQYYDKTYGSLLEKLKLKLKFTFDKLIKPSTIIILIILGLLISICSIIYIYQKYTFDFLQFIAIILMIPTIILMIPTAIYSIIWTYDWYKREKYKN